MTKRSAMAAVFSLGLAGTMVLAGCGSGGGGGGSGSGTPAANSSGAATGGGGGAATTGGSGGGGSSSSLIQKTDGNFVMVKLNYNEQVFGIPGQQCGANPGPCFDQGGYSLDPTDPAWPKPNTEATASGIKFWFPDTGSGKKVVKSGINFGPEQNGKVTVPTPQDKFKKLDLLAGAGNSNASQMADIQFDYTDGSKDTAQQNIDDWCNSTPVGQAGFTPAGRMDPTGTAASPACGLFVYSIPIPGSSKTLKDVVLTNDANNAGNFEPEVIAMTLEK